MSLNYDYSAVADQDKLFVTATAEDAATGNYIEGKEYFKPRYETLIRLTPVLGIDSITEFNWGHVFTRIALYESLFGPFYVDAPYLPEHIQDLIGLRVNVSRETWRQYTKRITDHFQGKLLTDVIKPAEAKRLQAEVDDLSDQPLAWVAKEGEEMNDIQT